MIQWLLAAIIGLPLLLVGFYIGANSSLQPEKHLMLPLCTSLMFFQVLLISMPETHFKITTELTSKNPIDRLAKEQSTFPLGLFAILISFSLSLLSDKILIKDPNPKIPSQEPQPLSPRTSQLTSLLSLGLLGNLFANFYFVGRSSNKATFGSELFLQICNQFIMCLSAGFLLKWANANVNSRLILSIAIVASVIVGTCLGAFTEVKLVVAVGQAMTNGVLMYVATMMCMPFMGRRWIAYTCMVLGFLITLLYFPVCMILRV